MYTNCCKFCKSGKDVRKYRLKEGKEETNLENISDLLTDCITPHFAKFAPDCYNNMCLFDEVAEDCRIGTGESRPFSGITTVMDYCAHSHKDVNNMIGGCTVVVTLTKPENRDQGAFVEDEQFHVLPLYVPDATLEELEQKVESGGIEALSSFHRTITIKNIAKKSCKRGRMTAEKKRMLDGYVPENYKSKSPSSSTRPTKKSPVKKIAKTKPIKQQIAPLTAQRPSVITKNVQKAAKTNLSTLPSSYQPSYQRRPIPSTLTTNPLKASYATASYPMKGSHPATSYSSTPSYSSAPLVESQSLYQEFAQPISQSFGQYQVPTSPARPHIRTITIDNPCLMRTLPPAPSYIPRIPKPQNHQPSTQPQIYQSAAQPHNFSQVPRTQAYQIGPQPQIYQTVSQPRNYQPDPQPRAYQTAPQPRTYQHPPQSRIYQHPPQSRNYQLAHQPQNYQPSPQHPTYPPASQPHRPGAMPVSTGFVSSIVSQFNDSDSILALLEEASGPEESSLEEAEDTAAAIYANYTSRLPQLDGADELEDEGALTVSSEFVGNIINQFADPDAILAQLDFGSEIEKEQASRCLFGSNINSQYRNPLQSAVKYNIEPPQSHNSYQDSASWDNSFQELESSQTRKNFLDSAPDAPLDYDPEDFEEAPEKIYEKDYEPEDFEDVPDDEVLLQQPDPRSYESECLEAFADPRMGGIALALPHGSILIEVAKAELHATTALKAPNKSNPCRIGLVWYQHKNLHFANHGAGESKKKTEKREFRDYINWLKGEWVMTRSQLNKRQKSGYVFPDNVKIVKHKDEKSKPEDRFCQEDYPNFNPGKFVDGKFNKINIKVDLNLEVFLENISQRNQNNDDLNFTNVKNFSDEPIYSSYY